MEKMIRQEHRLLTTMAGAVRAEEREGEREDEEEEEGEGEREEGEEGGRVEQLQKLLEEQVRD